MLLKMEKITLSKLSILMKHQKLPCQVGSGKGKPDTKQKTEAVAEVSAEDFVTSKVMESLIWVDPIHMGMLG